MESSKILTVLCAFVLVVCLVLSITTLTVLRNAVEENDALQEDAAALVGNLNACVEDLNAALEESDSIPTSSDTSTPTDTLADSFCVREVNGKIGVYTSDGYLVHLLDVSVDTLPAADREALSAGICVGSWRELIAIIQDYTA